MADEDQEENDFRSYNVGKFVVYCWRIRLDGL